MGFGGATQRHKGCRMQVGLQEECWAVLPKASNTNGR